MTDLTNKILQGRGSKKAEMVLRGGKIFDLITGNFLEGDVAICGDTIVGTCDTYEAKKIIKKEVGEEQFKNILKLIG